MQDVKEIQKNLHPPMVEGDHTFATVTDKISDRTLKKRTPYGWFIGFALALHGCSIAFVHQLFIW
ncbi:MAG: hypothetical protein WKF71_02575 [Pyrinomonadaceae bacterium]